MRTCSDLVQQPLVYSATIAPAQWTYGFHLSHVQVQMIDFSSNSVLQRHSRAEVQGSQGFYSDEGVGRLKITLNPKTPKYIRRQHSAGRARAGKTEESMSATLMLDAPRMTWKLVTMCPCRHVLEASSSVRHALMPCRVPLWLTHGNAASL